MSESPKDPALNMQHLDLVCRLRHQQEIYFDAHKDLCIIHTGSSVVGRKCLKRLHSHEEGPLCILFQSQLVFQRREN